jgi:hypothetical protein
MGDSQLHRRRIHLDNMLLSHMLLDSFCFLSHRWLKATQRRAASRQAASAGGGGGRPAGTCSNFLGGPPITESTN